jgi:hypothetical protein
MALGENERSITGRISLCLIGAKCAKIQWVTKHRSDYSGTLPGHPEISLYPIEKVSRQKQPRTDETAPRRVQFFWGYNADKKCVLLSGGQAGLAFAESEKAQNSVKKYADFFWINYEKDTSSTRQRLEGHCEMAGDAKCWCWCPRSECVLSILWQYLEFGYFRNYSCKLDYLGYSEKHNLWASERKKGGISGSEFVS